MLSYLIGIIQLEHTFLQFAFYLLQLPFGPIELLFHLHQLTLMKLFTIDCSLQVCFELVS